MSTNPPEEMPSSILKAEHQVILRVLAVLGRLVHRVESGGPLEVEALRRCVEFFCFFADACHHAKEEDLLFPVMESRGIPREGGPIGVMLYEHTLARRYTREMGQALDAFNAGRPEAQAQFVAAARAYMELLDNHIHKEDNVLFNMGDQVMTPEDQVSLCGQFCAVGCRSFGGKDRETLARMAEELEAEWPA